MRQDLLLICNLVKNNSRILDIGCGNGELMQLLIKNKNAKIKGIERSEDKVTNNLSKNLSVIQGDAEKIITYYPENYFDYAILSDVIQNTKKPKELLLNIKKICKNIIISFPNFAFYKNQFYLFFKKRMPVNKFIPYEWYDTPNIHFCTIYDFKKLSQEIDMNIIKIIYFTKFIKKNNIFNKFLTYISPNFFASNAIFLISKY